MGIAKITAWVHTEAWEYNQNLSVRSSPIHASRSRRFGEVVLRYRSPVQSMCSLSAQDVALDGQVISERSSLLAWIGVPETQHLRPWLRAESVPRLRNGVHLCLGAPLARLEARCTGTVLEPISSQIVYGVK